jgi:3-deoxy-D-manno-octulosonate 8-phosphate phosphatase (KDO 8-P phosphatase)
LNIEDVRLGIKNKQLELDSILEYYNVNIENVLFLGDFINDYLIMKSVGIPVCPSNACEEIKEIAKIKLKIAGGNGVVWDLTKKILRSKGIFNEIFQKYLKSLS